MLSPRKIKTLFPSKPTIEGAGVHLKRGFGFDEVPLFDPFLLFDDFRSNTPAHFIKGFPWHPHRGIETITYVLQGDVEHGDSLDNKGVIGSGDIQWMTAGSGIIHQEMPKGDETGRMAGFQLWANLPAKDKMMNPRYRDIASHQVPQVTLPGGAIVKVIAGTISGVKGPVQDIVIDPEYLDVTIPSHATFNHPTKKGHTAFLYLFEGEAYFSNTFSPEAPWAADATIVLFDDGDMIELCTAEKSARFLLISGKPIGEAVAWRGPIVMNTHEELQLAFKEYQEGNFIKYRG